MAEPRGSTSGPPQEHRDALDALAKALIERETPDEAEFLAVTGADAAPGRRTERGRRARERPDRRCRRGSDGDDGERRGKVSIPC